MDETPRIAEKLVDVSRDELLFDLEFGMKYQDGKARRAPLLMPRWRQLRG